MTQEIQLPTSIFGKPVLRTEANKTEEHRKASRLDLFFDLFFVAAIRVISHEFAHDLGHWSRGALVQTVIYIVAIWRLWTSITYFFERYKTEGLTKRLFMFVQMFLIAGVGLTMMGGSEAVHIFFLLYGLAKGGIASMYLRTNTGHKDPLYCKNNRLQIYGNSMVLIASIIALFLPGAWSVWILLMALGLDVLIPILGKSTLKYLVPSFEVETYHERFGLFIIIVLGESILGAITGIHWDSLTHGTLSLIGAALLLSFVHWWIYFEYVSTAKILKENILSRTYLHLPLTICFTLISATVLYLVEHSTETSHGPMLLLIVCCIIVMATVIGFEKITGPYSKLVPKTSAHLRHMGLPIIGMIFLLPNRGLSNQTSLWIITIFAIIPIAIRAYLLTQGFRKHKASQE
ncbi:Bacterial low temperature requirement A protein (LtrA) [candidate division SR1 bacterium Aalborg_AAW-1]|nr:Bacterial low temperature requirement A protein (LtrA) [candidate division SR1 bacterium Aalborg_AAW-1]